MTKPDRPNIVCLCGSTKFAQAFEKANLDETIAGNIVLTVGSMTQSNDSLKELITPEIKTRLDLLHLEKIKLSDQVLILNVGGYVGESTFNEFLFAYGLGKTIAFLETDNIPVKCLKVLARSFFIDEPVDERLDDLTWLREAGDRLKIPAFTFDPSNLQEAAKRIANCLLELQWKPDPTVANL
jgi:hypothetical protein